MLGKLFKYEIKATSRLFLPLYLAVIFFALINRILNPFRAITISNNMNLQAILSSISAFVYFALIIGVGVMTLIIMIQRFYKSLLGDEGYLMHTLPVKSWQHIVSKLLVSMLWIFLSFATVLCSLLLVVNAREVFNELPKVIGQIRVYLGNTGLFMIPVYALVAAAYYVIVIYDAMAIGHLLSKHKILASFGAYIILYIISQMVTSILVFAFANNIVTSMNSAAIPTPAQISTFIASVTGVLAVLAIANFYVTNYILTKKLNLE